MLAIAAYDQRVNETMENAKKTLAGLFKDKSETPLGVFNKPLKIVDEPLNDDGSTNFLEAEIIPIANKDANAFRITKDPSRRAVCGVSSGGIAAFSCAWFRPDLFGGVISHGA